MRKRIFSTLLALCLVISLLPAAAFAAEGEEGTETSSESQTVAQIGETTYTDFASALTAATSGNVTIKLLADVSTATLSCNNITYDLNGKTLTYTSGNSIVVGENQTLTFMDSSVSGTDRGGTLKLNAFANSYLAAINVQKNGTVDASNIKIEGNCSVFYPQGNAAAVKVTNCDVSAGCYCVGTNAGTSSNYGVQITLTGSAFVATNDDKDNCPVMNQCPGYIDH